MAAIKASTTSKNRTDPMGLPRIEWVPIGELQPNARNARTHYPALKASVQALAKRFGARRILVEDAGTGTSLVQELQGRVSGIIAVKPEGDKASRMAVASAKFEAGQVLLPERATWLPDLEAELFVFPGSRHDDQCDSISQALLDKNNSFWTYLSSDDWQRLLTESRKPARRAVLGLSVLT